MSTTAVRRALYGKLAGDSTLTALLASPPTGYSKSIFYELAPQEASFPFVVFQKMSGRPRYAMDKTANLENEIWMFKAVDRAGSADGADAISARIDALLIDGTISISGATQLYLRREGSVDYSEVDAGTRYIHSGATFRLIYQA